MPAIICEVCKTNQAVVFLTQIIDRNMKKVKLCAGCAEEHGVMNEIGREMLRKGRAAGDDRDGEAPLS